MKHFFFHPTKPKSQLFTVKQDKNSSGHSNPQSVNTICESQFSYVLPELQTENENYSNWFLFIWSISFIKISSDVKLQTHDIGHTFLTWVIGFTCGPCGHVSLGLAIVPDGIFLRNSWLRYVLLHLIFGGLGSGEQKHGVSSDLLRVGRRERGSPASMRWKQEKTGAGWGGGVAYMTITHQINLLH